MHTVRLRWQAASHLAGGFLLRQIREDGLVVGALENTDIYPQTSTALEGLDALFVLANISSTNKTSARVYTEAGVRSAGWYALNAWVPGTGLVSSQASHQLLVIYTHSLTDCL